MLFWCALEAPYNLFFVGDANQEIEDLIKKDFYRDVIIDTYRIILANRPNKFKDLKNRVIELFKSMSTENKQKQRITK